MFYVPATTLATPVLVQETRTVTIPTTTYYALQTTPVIPTVPILTTAFAYPTLGLLAKPITKDTSEKTQTREVTPPVQHVIHHYVPSCTTCCNGCDLCCPWRRRSPDSGKCSRSPSPSPSRPRSPSIIIHHHPRPSRRDQSTETIDYFRPKSPVVHPVYHVPFKPHCDSPQPGRRSRSASSHRSSSLPREPWRSTNRNDYPWRDAHLPAYREATLTRPQTSSNEDLRWKETAHQRSHLNTENQTSYHSKNDYVYRPKSETEARKYYVQTTGKNPDCEVYSALYNNATAASRAANAYHNYKQTTRCDHSFYSDIPTRDIPTQVNYTSTNNTDGNNSSCLHILPKHSSTLEPPYLKIYNAPVTYLH